MAKAAAKETILITPVKIRQIRVRLVGDSPLITHNWDVKAQRKMLEDEMGIKGTGKEKKDPFSDFASSLYWLDRMPDELTKEALDEAFTNGARFGFPVTGIKQAAISAAYRAKWSNDKVSLRGAFFIDPEFEGYYSGDLEISDDQKKIDIVPNIFHSEGMAELHYDQLTMRRDMVRVGMGSADIRYRGQFENWHIDMTITYNENDRWNPDQIITMLNAGGYTVGIGEWRPEKSGRNGMFHCEPLRE